MEILTNSISFPWQRRLHLLKQLYKAAEYDISSYCAVRSSRNIEYQISYELLPHTQTSCMLYKWFATDAFI